MKWTKKAAPAEQSEREPELSAYQRAMRNRLLAVPVVPAPEPWQPVFGCTYGVAVGGLLGIGFATHPDSGHDLVMVVSSDGHGLFDAVTGYRIARDRDPNLEDSTPDAVADLSCPGLGPIAGSRVRIAGLFGGGLHTGDGWALEVVTPAWPNERVLLSRDGRLPHSSPHAEQWWHIFQCGEQLSHRHAATDGVGPVQQLCERYGAGLEPRPDRTAGTTREDASPCLSPSPAGASSVAVLANCSLMGSEVIAALIGTPAVLVTAAAAWAAGRAQGRGTYHGTVDAVRRAAQREAYAELHRTARRFIEVHKAAEVAAHLDPPRDLTADRDAALDGLEHAADMVSLEGPDGLADIAERLSSNARRFGGQRDSVTGGRIVVFNADDPLGHGMLVESVRSFNEALDELLPEARRYLNGGPTP